MPAEQGAGHTQDIPIEDEPGDRGLPVGSLLGLLCAALVVVVVLMQLRSGRPAPAVGVDPPRSVTTIAGASYTPVPARLYYLVSDRAQAQELAEAFTRGAVGGDILLAGTKEQEARAWRIISDQLAAHPSPNTGPPRVVDLREPDHSPAATP